MTPTVRHKDWLLTSKYQSIKRFDLVYIKTPKTKEKTFRRVIGVPGDSIYFDSDELYVNDEKISEKYLVNKKKQMGSMVLTENFTLKEVIGHDKIPKNYYFVLGDNRLSSTDSRYYSLVSEEEIIGKVKLRLLPISQFKIF